MEDKMKILEHNVNTGEILEIEMTEEQASAQIRFSEELSRPYKESMEKKKDLLDRLGLTEEEAKLLLS